MESLLPLEKKLFRNKDDGADNMQLVLKLPWTHSVVLAEPHPLWVTKRLFVQVLSKIVPISRYETDLEVLDLGFHDDAEEVRIETVISMPVIVLWSGFGRLTHMFQRLQ
ncbi:hypothetical protein F0562_027422 [Nyssa sinensis]|uniref:Uncharacterized protein n=1 Tax=Nyssa sinensis TaxID=561372 RepID=A0A5J5B5W5_9ASTE|nr:hypothetical protein F0562_027422 [Nyssa sinensis]